MDTLNFFSALSTLFVQNPVMKMLQRGLTQKFQPRQSDGVKTNKIEVDQLLPTVICMERSELEVEFEVLNHMALIMRVTDVISFGYLYSWV